MGKILNTQGYLLLISITPLSCYLPAPPMETAPTERYTLNTVPTAVKSFLDPNRKSINPTGLIIEISPFTKKGVAPANIQSDYMSGKSLIIAPLKDVTQWEVILKSKPPKPKELLLLDSIPRNESVIGAVGDGGQLDKKLIYSYSPPESLSVGSKHTDMFFVKARDIGYCKQLVQHVAHKGLTLSPVQGEIPSVNAHTTEQDCENLSMTFNFDQRHILEIQVNSSQKVVDDFNENACDQAKKYAVLTTATGALTGSDITNSALTLSRKTDGKVDWGKGNLIRIIGRAASVLVPLYFGYKATTAAAKCAG